MSDMQCNVEFGYQLVQSIPEGKKSITSTRTKWLKLFAKIITVYYENHMKQNVVKMQNYLSLNYAVRIITASH
jgi:hypothetical protein